MDELHVSELIANQRNAIKSRDARIETLEEDIKNWKRFLNEERDEHAIDLQRLKNLREEDTRKQNQINNLKDEVRYWSKIAESRLQELTPRRNVQDVISDLQAENDSLKGYRDQLETALEEAAHDKEQLGIADAALTKALAEAKKYKDAYMHTCDNYTLHAQIENLKMFRDGLLKDMEDMENERNLLMDAMGEKNAEITQLKTDLRHAQQNFMDAEKSRIQTKAGWDSKQKEVRDSRQQVGALEEQLQAVIRDRNYWKQQANDVLDDLKQCRDAAQTSHDQAVKYAKIIGIISKTIDDAEEE